MTLTNTAIGLTNEKNGSIDTATVLTVTNSVLQELIRRVAIFPISECYIGRAAIEFSVAIVDGKPGDRIQVALIPATLPGLSNEPVIDKFFARSI